MWLLEFEWIWQIPANVPAHPHVHLPILPFTYPSCVPIVQHRSQLCPAKSSYPVLWNPTDGPWNHQFPRPFPRPLLWASSYFFALQWVQKPPLALPNCNLKPPVAFSEHEGCTKSGNFANHSSTVDVSLPFRDLSCESSSFHRGWHIFLQNDALATVWRAFPRPCFSKSALELRRRMTLHIT